MLEEDEEALIILKMAERKPAKKRVRGCAKLNFLKTQLPGQKFEVDMTRGFQPSGKHAAHLSRFIGVLARDGNKFPLNEPCFSEFKKKLVLRQAIAEVKDYFDFSSSYSDSNDLDDWVTDKLGELWKAHKAKVKEENFTPYATDDLDQNLQIPPPPEIEEDVWDSLVRYWSTSDAKEISQRNKANRLKKKLNHKGGSKSFANYSVELEKELHRPPTRKEIFIRTHIDQDHPKEGEAAEKAKEMEEMESLITAGLCDTFGEQLDEYGPNDVFSKVMGKDKGGRVRCYGNTAKPEKIWGHKKGSHSTISKLQKENQCLKSQLGTIADLLNHTIARLNRIERAQINGSTSHDEGH